MSSILRPSRLTILAILSIGAIGCASGGSSTTSGLPRARVDPQLISRAELMERNFNNLFDAIQALRGNWLRPRSSDSFSTPTTLQVYMDNQRIGGVEQLRQLQVINVASVRWYDGIAATARWGLDHGAGVIYIVTAK